MENKLYEQFTLNVECSVRFTGKQLIDELYFEMKNYYIDPNTKQKILRKNYSI